MTLAELERAPLLQDRDSGSTIPARRIRRPDRYRSGARALGDFSIETLWHSRWIMDNDISLSEPLRTVRVSMISIKLIGSES